MKVPASALFALSLVALTAYLFVSAPPVLPETAPEAAGAIPIERVLETVAAENAAVRTLYTAEIVARGPDVGLRFDERWRDQDLEAGPLPALFLREVARALQRGPVPLGLFLGSDFPIVAANRFRGKQTEVFERMKRTGAPEYFADGGTGVHTAMFPDVASVPGCVSCHNQHPDSPKQDWKLDELMGATTWTYPKATVSHAEYLRIVAAVRVAIRSAYQEYLEEAASFAKPPVVGERWPADGYYLPSADVFMAEVARRASAATVDRLLAAGTAP